MSDTVKIVLFYLSILVFGAATFDAGYLSGRGSSGCVISQSRPDPVCMGDTCFTPADVDPGWAYTPKGAAP